MRRVSSRLLEAEPLPEEQETEGERQLHNLLRQQLDTSVDFQQCLAKKRCFAPAALYKPFGEQAAGVRSLSQFQVLQDQEKEFAQLRDLGLTDSEIELWLNKETKQKTCGLRAEPSAVEDRLRCIKEKITQHKQLLDLPQRFAGSRGLSRREMEIEKAMFQGEDRHSFLRSLYHHDKNVISEGSESSPYHNLDIVSKDLKSTAVQQSSLVFERKPKLSTCNQSEVSPSRTECLESTSKDKICNPPKAQESEEFIGPRRLDLRHPIGKLNASTVECPLKVTEEVQSISEEEIKRNKLTTEEIRQIPKFQNYHPGLPSKVLYLKNLSPRATLSHLISLFSVYQSPASPPLLYRLLTGRLKGQAFITFPDLETATKALELVNGYHLLGKPVIIEFGRGSNSFTSSQTSGRQPAENITTDSKEIP
ncbi:RBM41 protein, partial [Polypterus senegalus]